jgi:hypothetical protein
MSEMKNRLFYLQGEVALAIGRLGAVREAVENGRCPGEVGQGNYLTG